MPPPSNDPIVVRTAALAGDLRAVIGKLSRRLREQAHTDEFTWPQKLVLLRLERDGPATVTTLARAEGVRPQSMGETLSVLKTAGLVSGAPDPTDGRQTVLSLTPQCLEMLKTKRAAKEDWLFHVLQAHLTPDEQQELANSIQLLKRLTES